MAPTLNAFDSGDTRATVIAFNWQNGGGYGNANEGLAITEEGVGPLSVSQVPAVTAQPTVRRLTPRECERLQGFPDDWTAGQADSHRYRQMGNAVTVNVAAYVGALIVDAMQHDAGGAA